MDHLTVRGARQHNLDNLDLDLPRHRLVVITGPSGCGKSSLAFDTIYAEGQRRYVESLSAYARQFLEQLPKPDVDSIEGLSPAIAIEQRALGKSPRSTVGTVTEIADYLRLLFSKVGTPHCPISGVELRAFTVQEIVDLILDRPAGTRLVLLAPVQRGLSEAPAASIAQLRRQGFVRARVNGVDVDLADPGAQLPTAEKYDLEVVIDRIVVKPGVKGRVTDSVELALKMGEGTLLLDALDGSHPEVLSEQLVSWEHGVVLPPLEPKLFSFNSPHGACARCGGLGEVSELDLSRLLPDDSKTLREGALLAFGRRGSLRLTSELKWVVDCLHVDVDVPWSKLPAAQQRALLQGETGVSRRRKKPAYPGVLPRLQRLLDGGEDEDEDDTMEAGEPTLADDLPRFIRSGECPDCNGQRLRREALAVRLAGHTIADLCRMSLEDLRATLEGLQQKGALADKDAPIAAPLLKAMVSRLGFLGQVGLGYLTLDRSVQTLSGGEGQRIRLATQIGAALVGVLYVLDEPSVGLHARDNARLLSALRKLVDKGNSVLVVEHDREAILAADYVVDMGPRAGVGGGQVVAQGPPSAVLANPRSVTAPYLRSNAWLPIPSPRKAPSKQAIRVEGARAHNLKDVDAEFPLGLLTVVTGVSGAGKSGLVVDTLLAAARAKLYGSSGRVGSHRLVAGLEAIDKVVSIDQAPIGRTPRSNPATYTGIFTHLRELFAGLPEARARGYKAGRFSFNIKGGRCEACQGDGVLRVEMHFLPDVYILCKACSGQRYNRETLEVLYKGLSIAQVLDLTVDEALKVFEAVPRIYQRMAALHSVGLGYLQLGQAATTLSGGEAQRVKLAAELSKKSTGRTLYVLDEPTTGLHFSDIELLLKSLLELREAGNTIIVIEHNLDLAACADWIIDMGPHGGAGGGRILATGTPEEVAVSPHSVTGPFLDKLLH